MSDSASAGSTSNVASTSAAAPARSVAAKGGARACLNCRKLKKTVCDPLSFRCNGAEPCDRCEKNNVADQCVFDRPPPTLLEDPKGLERLIAMEGMMAQLMESISDISKNVTQILINQQTQAFSSPASGSAAEAIASLFPQSVLPDLSDALLPPVPTPSSTLLATTSFIARREPTLPPQTQNEETSFLPQAHISPPSDNVPPESKSFEASLDTPIEALARAAQAASVFLPDDQTRLAEETQLAEHVSGSLGGSSREGSTKDFIDDDSRPRKRTRIAFLPTKTSSLEQLDVVAKGLVSDRQARDWVDLFMTKLQPYCPIVDPVYDTYERLRRTSHVLFNTIVYLAARTSGGPNPPSPTLVSVAAETRAYAQQLIFETQPPIDCIQALILMAVWHDEPYNLSGYALRMACSIRLEKTFAHFDAHGWEMTDPKARSLITRLRSYIYLVYLDFKHSASTGRMILISPTDIEVVEKNVDKIFLSPLSTVDDNRMVANLKLTILHRNILRSSPPVLQSPFWDPSEAVEFHRTLQGIIQKWFDSYDNALAVQYPTDYNFPRRSHLRSLTDGKLFMAGLVFKDALLERSPHAAVVAVAHEAFRYARASMQTVLQSSTYLTVLQYCGFLTRVDLSFACMMALKLAALYPELVEADEIVGEVLRVAELISSCSGSQRYSMSLRVAADQFLSKVGPSRGDTGPVVDPLSAMQELSHTQQASESTALLPGEVEIDWTSLASSFMDTSDLLIGDWIPYSNDNDNWFDDFTLGSS